MAALESFGGNRLVRGGFSSVIVGNAEQNFRQGSNAEMQTAGTVQKNVPLEAPAKADQNFTREILIK